MALNIREDLWDLFPELVFFDSPLRDSSVVGLSLVNDNGTAWCVTYDEGMVLGDYLKEGLNEEDALDWHCYNVLGSYIGESTPVFLDYEDNAIRFNQEYSKKYLLDEGSLLDAMNKIVEDNTVLYFVKLEDIPKIQELL